MQIAKKELIGLWANTCVHMLPEQEYNMKMAKLYPHCSICQYFIPRSFWYKSQPVESLPSRFPYIKIFL